ncbi:MAG TPA: hypothetical protein VFZ34_04185 [Blastocatellia bacterium]|nr:hypothetical protein [Blastocatellia bacterium]
MTKSPFNKPKRKRKQSDDIARPRSRKPAQQPARKERCPCGSTRWFQGLLPASEEDVRLAD